MTVAAPADWLMIRCAPGRSTTAPVSFRHRAPAADVPIRRQCRRCRRAEPVTLCYLGEPATQLGEVLVVLLELAVGEVLGGLSADLGQEVPAFVDDLLVPVIPGGV